MVYLSIKYKQYRKRREHEQVYWKKDRKKDN